MEIYTPSEICSKLDGVTPRQITDLAEKGIIVPAKPSAGQGSMRLYGKANIREMLIALSLRGIISGKPLRSLLDKILLAQPGVTTVSVSYGRRKNVFKIVAHKKDREESMVGEIEVEQGARFEATPKLFINFWIDIVKINKFIKANF